jgi:hypothetical protein
MTKLILAGLVMLAGCGADQTRPLPDYKPLPVNIEVPTSCVDVNKIPIEPPMVSDQFDGNASHDFSIAAASAAALRTALQPALVMLHGCVIPATKP